MKSLLIFVLARNISGGCRLRGFLKSPFLFVLLGFLCCTCVYCTEFLLTTNKSILGIYDMQYFHRSQMLFDLIRKGEFSDITNFRNVKVLHLLDVLYACEIYFRSRTKALSI